MIVQGDECRCETPSRFKLRQLRETRKLQKVGNIEIMENVAIVFEADPDVCRDRARAQVGFNY